MDPADRVDRKQVTPPDGEAGRVANTLDEVAADMTAAHEGFPRGVRTDGGEAWSWVYHSRLSYGNDMPADWGATVPWGQVYVDTSGRSAEGVRFQVRNLRQYYLSEADSTWRLLTDLPDDIAGANYLETFADDENAAADIRSEVGNGGGISATVPDNFNFHFFPRDRAEIDPADIAGMWSVFEGRILPGQAAEAYQPLLLANVGGDYWESTTAEWDDFKTNGDWGIGRFKYLDADWHSFNAHTLDEATLRAYPPPGL